MGALTDLPVACARSVVGDRDGRDRATPDQPGVSGPRPAHSVTSWLWPKFSAAQGLQLGTVRKEPGCDRSRPRQEARVAGRINLHQTERRPRLIWIRLAVERLSGQHRAAGARTGLRASRAIGAIAALEEQLGRPAVTANQWRSNTCCAWLYKSQIDDYVQVSAN